MRDESTESQREEGTAKAWLPMRESLAPGAHSYNCFRFPDLPKRGMKKRGKVLRDPRTGPGLLMIEGRQYWFCLEGVWKSEIPPKPGLTVDVKLDQAGRILAITAVSDSQLAEEQAERSVDTGKAAGVKILRKIAAKCGMPNLLRR
jgi:hypothetical protein